MIDYHQVIELLSRNVWPVFRLSGLLLVVPIFSSDVVPNRIRVIFILTLSFIASGFIPEKLSFEFFSSSFVIYVLQEVALGILMGFILQIVFQSFILGGQIIAMQMGLGFATMVDPSSKANVPLISQFYLILVTLIFLALNGHLMVLEMLISSFTTMPIGQVSIDKQSAWSLLMFSSFMFKSALMIALPAIISLLLVNLSFGIMTRVAPQLNIFSIGFPITLTLGVVILFVTLYGVLPHVKSTLNHGFETMQGVIQQ